MVTRGFYQCPDEPESGRLASGWRDETIVLRQKSMRGARFVWSRCRRLLQSAPIWVWSALLHKSDSRQKHWGYCCWRFAFSGGGTKHTPRVSHYLTPTHSHLRILYCAPTRLGRTRIPSCFRSGMSPLNLGNVPVSLRSFQHTQFQRTWSSPKWSQFTPDNRSAQLKSHFTRDIYPQIKSKQIYHFGATKNRKSCADVVVVCFGYSSVSWCSFCSCLATDEKCVCAFYILLHSDEREPI